MKFSFLLLALSIRSIIFSQDKSVLLERSSFKLVLPIDKGNYYETNVPSSLYVQHNNIVQIYPGETIFLELKKTGDNIALKAVKEIKVPEKTITISCFQNVVNGKHENITLKIDNPFDKGLKYSARIFLMKTNKWTSTVVYPIQAKLSSIEIWPDIIITLSLSNWQFL